MELGLQLKSIRKIKGYTQKQVCDEIGISQTYLSHVETGKVNVSSNLLNFMCWFYKVPTQFVYWKTLKDTDVPLRKRKQFKQLNPVMLSLIDTIIKEKP
jgi:transcriptional regulator with XRE-family HTH domain